jgi:predicted membrane-bound mannosyltransferase
MRETVGLSTYTSSVLVIFYLLCLFGLFRTLNNNNSPYLFGSKTLLAIITYCSTLINGTLTLRAENVYH